MTADAKAAILIVDDQPENLLAMEAALQDLGQELLKAGSGKEALKLALHRDFAVILLDVKMPVMDGIETARLLREREKSRYTPIIFLTAFSTDHRSVLEGYRLGAVDFLFKPFESMEIIRFKVSVFVDLHLAKERERRISFEREHELIQIQELKKSLAEYQRIFSSSSTSITGLMYGKRRLRESRPAVFGDLVDRYTALLDQAIEMQALRVEHDLSGPLSEMADEIGKMGAGPRDVVDVHRTTLTRMEVVDNPQKMQAYAREGRYLVLELMGDLASFYRNYYTRGWMPKHEEPSAGNEKGATK